MNNNTDCNILLDNKQQYNNNKYLNLTTNKNKKSYFTPRVKTILFFCNNNKNNLVSFWNYFNFDMLLDVTNNNNKL